MKSWISASLRTVAVVTVLLATTYGCSVLLSEGDPPPPPDPHQFFAGCYSGAPGVGGDLTLVMRTVVVMEPGQDDRVSLQGCMRFELDGDVETGTLTGMVASDEREAVSLSGVLSGGSAAELDVTRSPSGDVAAESVAIDSPDEKFRVDRADPCNDLFDDLCPSTLAAR